DVVVETHRVLGAAAPRATVELEAHRVVRETERLGNIGDAAAVHGELLGIGGQAIAGKRLVVEPRPDVHHAAAHGIPDPGVLDRGAGRGARGGDAIRAVDLPFEAVGGAQHLAVQLEPGPTNVEVPLHVVGAGGSGPLELHPRLEAHSHFQAEVVGLEDL